MSEEGKDLTDLEMLAVIFGWRIHQEDDGKYLMTNKHGTVMATTYDQNAVEFDLSNLVVQKYIEGLMMAFIFMKGRFTKLLDEAKGQKKKHAYIRNNIKEFLNTRDVIPLEILEMLKIYER